MIWGYLVSVSDFAAEPGEVGEVVPLELAHLVDALDQQSESLLVVRALLHLLDTLTLG